MKKAYFTLFLLGCFILEIHAQKFTIQQKDGQKLEFKVISKENKKVVLTSAANKGAAALNIPGEVNYKNVSYEVVLVGDKALTGCDDKLRELSFPNSVQEIGSTLFGNFMSVGAMMAGPLASSKHPLSKVTLEKLFIPKTIRSIGDCAFSVGRESSSAMMTSVMNGAGGLKPLKAHIVELPTYIGTAQAESFGLSRTSVATYWGENPQVTDASGAMLAAMPASTDLTPVRSKMVSDVDMNIPETLADNDKTFAVIFANENYQEEVTVDYALNDGEMFKEYCHKVLGLPEDNVHIRKDATLNNIRAEISWMQQVANAYNGQANFIVFYAGHGIPDEKSGTAYLLPVDGKGTMLDTGYSLAKFYETLGNMPAERVTVFMDACFSGSKRGEGMLASARGVAIKAKTQAPQGKMVVFSAAQGDETAYPLKDKEHGLFTYYLLKKLKDTKGDVTYDELGTYIADEVSRKSIVANGKSQTPTVIPSQNVVGNWKTMKLK